DPAVERDRPVEGPQEGPAHRGAGRDGEGGHRWCGRGAAREGDGAGGPGGQGPEPQDGPSREGGVVHVHELSLLLTRRRGVGSAVGGREGGAGSDARAGRPAAGARGGGVPRGRGGPCVPGPPPAGRASVAATSRWCVKRSRARRPAPRAWSSPPSRR